jgi:hypothetical protein
LSALLARLRTRLRGVSPSSLSALAAAAQRGAPKGALCGRPLPPQLPSPVPPPAPRDVAIAHHCNAPGAP